MGVVQVGSFGTRKNCVSGHWRAQADRPGGSHKGFGFEKGVQVRVVGSFGTKRDDGHGPARLAYFRCRKETRP